MDVHRIRHLPVVENDKLVGMLSIRDLVRAIVDQQIFISSQLESYITGRSWQINKNSRFCIKQAGSLQDGEKLNHHLQEPAIL